MNWEDVQGYNTTYRSYEMTKQDRQCRYNITLRCVRATIAVVDKK